MMFKLLNILIFTSYLVIALDPDGQTLAGQSVSPGEFGVIIYGFLSRNCNRFFWVYRLKMLIAPPLGLALCFRI